MELAEVVATRVRSERTRRDWTLEQAAVRLGVSRRSLVDVEGGRANPSLSTLLSIAGGFGVDVADLVSLEARSTTQVLQLDNSSAEIMWSSARGGSARLLAALGPLETWSWRLEPGDIYRSKAHRKGSIESIIVVNGVIDVVIDGMTTTVARNQTLHFAADHPHEYRNDIRRTARFFLTVVDPIDPNTTR